MKTIPQSGFSLIELLVTLSIVSLLMTIAVPSFQDLIERNRVQALMDEFTSSLYMVRGESAKRGYQVTLCASNTAKTDCDTSATDFASGWIIFVDYDGNGQLGAPGLLFDVNGNGINDTAETVLYASHVSAGGNYGVESTGVGDRLWQISYRADGLLAGNSNAGFSLVKHGESTELAGININQTGRIYSKITPPVAAEPTPD
ncbi:MAG: Unknown protein [uncultured Thiotrichaceae bacterium]|uniref:Type II secretion system protein H n=1 Tax=uncultured Thiotrichaceae bacterium TaxID=298394 RepID=A0A6S6U7Q4_9GAMM|nr:MAG: Unknown protein [uncultured Thiotrichaceae bacterium]